MNLANVALRRRWHGSQCSTAIANAAAAVNPDRDLETFASVRQTGPDRGPEVLYQTFVWRRAVRATPTAAPVGRDVHLTFGWPRR